MRPGADAGPRTLLTLAAAVTTLCAFSLLDPVFSTPGWWTGPVLAVCVVAAVGAAAQWVRVLGPLTPLLQLAALAPAVTGYHAPDTALLGVVPTPASVGRLTALGAAGLEEIRVGTTPVPASPGLTVLVTLCLGLLAVLVHLVAVTLRLAGLAGPALLALVFVPLTVHHEGVAWGAFTVTALGFLLLLGVESAVRTAAWGVRVRSDRWPPRRGRAPAADAARQALDVTRVAAVAVALALLLPLAVPGLVSDAMFALTSGVRGDGRTVTTVNPLASLRNDLTAAGDRQVLEYRTTESSPEYLRTHVLDAFDGADWTMSPVQASQRHRVDGALPEAPGFVPGPEDEPVTTDITVSAAVRQMDFLPLPYPSSGLLVPGEWFADPDTLMVFSPEEEAGGLTYQVTGSRPAPDPGDLAASGEPASVDGRYLELPPVPDEVAALTDSVVADAGNPYERAVALQDWFTGGGFEYDLRPPGVPAGTDPLSYFLLESRTGYCQHFSAAMAVMARYAGIPARVAVGYTAGENVGGDHWVVTQRNGHAWPELYFEGQGWLRFEPTPSASGGQPSADVPDYAAPAREETPEDAGREAAGTPGESAGPEREPEDAETPGPGQEAAPADRTAGGGAGQGSDAPPVAAAVAAALAVLLALPALVRRIVRGLRWGRASDARRRARAAWLELRDDLLDLGLGWNPAESPRAVGRRLEDGQRPAEHARAALRRVVAAEEAARYAPEPLPARDLADDSRAVRRALAAACPPRTRALALLLPRSLFTRKRPRRNSRRTV
ncbi:DUF3488 and transglutaminase-like domain-containing protein [Actinorugispora endophytica]|uniref:Transglutaminase superfamily protein n=1 Tax=Actinorugispora endophytica TaxID=1605990 RepID=A0A4V3D8P7_9ACTN|nr:DUF3488 and transglutaminase-like domain-containing protein [Actinorugispora endophytica]TDQ52589.1 transglutaminase superfamily protein [Actinorugispora endophytica]